jgi:hypothetical protein
MRLSRTYRAVLVFLFIGLFGAFGPAIDGDGSGFPAPGLMVWLDFAEEALFIEASGGEPGTAAAVNFLITNGPAPGIQQVPFTFDANGYNRLYFPLSLMNNGVDLAVGIQLLSISATGVIQESPIWALTSHNYVVTDPSTPPCSQCPTVPGGSIDWVTWPGTQTGPLYPLCLVALESDEGRAAGQPMIALQSGPAGSFPIN